MSVVKDHEDSSDSARVMRPRIWRSNHALEGVRELNEQLLEALCALALDAPAGIPPILAQCQPLWRALDLRARQRAAASAMLLLDLHSQDEPWWQWAVRHVAGNRKGRGRSPSIIPPKRAGELTRSMLMLAWPTARDDVAGASILFGMSRGVAALVGSLSAAQIDRVASRHWRELRPRWEDQPRYWQALLRAAQNEDEAALREFHLHDLQFLGRALLAGMGVALPRSASVSPA